MSMQFGLWERLEKENLCWSECIESFGRRAVDLPRVTSRHNREIASLGSVEGGMRETINVFPYKANSLAASPRFL